MSTTTTRIALVKETDAENYSVETVNANSDKIDSAVGLLECTSTTRPSAPYNGQAIRESDTGSVLYSNGSAPASGSWNNIFAASGPVIVGATGSAAPLRIQTTSTIAGNRAIETRKYGDSQPGYFVDFDGKMQWGAGGSSAPDTVLYRSSADTLRTDDALSVGGSLSVSGGLTVTGTYSGAVARGVISHFERTTSTTPTSSAARAFHISASMVAGRMYRIWTNSVAIFSTVAGDDVAMEVTYTTDGSTPTTSSPLLPGGAVQDRMQSTTNGMFKGIATRYTAASSLTMRLALCVRRKSGTGDVSLFADGTSYVIQLLVQDIGQSVAASGTLN